MSRVQAYGKANQYMCPRLVVCFATGMLELLLGKPQQWHHHRLLLILLRVWKLIRKLKLCDQKDVH